MNNRIKVNTQNLNISKKHTKTKSKPKSTCKFKNVRVSYMIQHTEQF